ncbi:hypothetical protein SAMN04488556_1436 [Halostagnicola kamekurae]|uniref:Uncharacterized protein n=1 Tax=Halostagnicola kamekurae TaxID=619731 RepID=A0A1I6QQ20_9EURY|nr:hypothetical protein SAMN04488556_1436 [Halostagnicola kamekurae]
MGMNSGEMASSTVLTQDIKGMYTPRCLIPRMSDMPNKSAIVSIETLQPMILHNSVESEIVMMTTTTTADELTNQDSEEYPTNYLSVTTHYGIV